MPPEKLKTDEEEPEIEEDLENGEGVDIEEQLRFEEELRIKAAQQEQRLNEITYINATTSPLLLLPAEIRNMIFALALDHQDIMIIRGRIYNKIRAPVNLLRVCRQIHAETALLPYKLNFFALSNLGELPVPCLQRRTQAQLDVMAGMEGLLMTDVADEVFAMMNWLEYRRMYKLAAVGIFKDMNSTLLAQNEE
ncbi:hypothetical protein J4E91_006849 [Alternaria rosae]|nr:hypothetical protein J4E91_006849 [Alternaria rosae]